MRRLPARGWGDPASAESLSISVQGVSVSHSLEKRKPEHWPERSKGTCQGLGSCKGVRREVNRWGVIWYFLLISQLYSILHLHYIFVLSMEPSLTFSSLDNGPRLGMSFQGREVAG